MIRRQPSSLRGLLVAGLCLSLTTSACGARFARPNASALEPGGGTGGQDTTGGLSPGDAGGDGGAGSGGATGQLPGSATGTTGGTSGTGTSGSGATSGTGGSTGTTGGSGTTGSGSGTSGGSSGSTGSTGSTGPVPPGPKPGITATSIKIGYLLPKTGAAPLPPQVEDGVQAYWRFLNGRGGVLGRKVDVTIYDTTSQDSGARAAAQKAVEDGNFAVVALDRLGVQGTIAKYLDARHFPNIAVQTPVGLPASMDWTFGITIDHKVQGKLIAQYMARGLKVKKVGVVYETDSTLQPGVDAFVAEAKVLKLEVVHKEPINGMDNQFLAEAQKLAKDNAEATWLYMAPSPAANIAKESESDGYRPIWFANSISWNFNLSLAAGGTAFNGSRGFSPWPALGDPRLATYNGFAPSGPPSVQDLGVPGWGIGQIVANALKNAGKDVGQNSFRDAMQHLQLTTTSPVDGTPLIWSPLSFRPGVRTGSVKVMTFKQTGSGNGTDTQWANEADYRSSY